MGQQYTLKVRAYIQIFITTVTVILLLMVWPFRVFNHSAVSTYGDTVLEETGAITMEEIVLQSFVPGGGHIAEMEIAVRAEQVHGMDRVFVTLYDDAYNQLWQEVVYFNDIKALGMLRIKPELDVIPGNLYHIGLNVHFDSIGTLHALYGSREDLGLPEQKDFAYGGYIHEGMAVPITYHYTAPFSLKLILVCVAGILFGAAILYLLTAKLSERLIFMDRVEKRLAKNIFCSFLCLIIIAGLAFCFYQLCIVRYFGGMALDIGVYSAACVIPAAAIVCWCFKRLRIAHDGVGNLLDKTEETEQEQDDRKVSQLPPIWKPVCPIVWQNYLQMLLFVLLLQSCVNYVNATIQWRQTMAAAWVLLLFGAACVCSFAKRELFRLYTPVWGILTVIAGVLYCRKQIGVEHGLQTGIIWVIAVFFWGLVLIRTISGFCSKRRTALFWPVGILWLLSCAGMMTFAHGKSWPIIMALSFTLFYLQHDSEISVKRVTHNFANAVLVHFVLMIILCLLFRPYHQYRFYRYPMWFHTVAATGMYLTLAEAVALVRLLLKMRDTKTIFRNCVSEWILHSVIISYASLTATRTAMMSVCGLLIVMAVGAAIVYRLRFRRYLQVFGLLVCMFILCVPVCYTASRCIPALVNRPYFVADLEDFDYAVKEGDEPDSDKYMNFKALMRLWGERLHLPEFLTRPFTDDVYVPENDVSVIDYEMPVYVAVMTDVTGYLRAIATVGMVNEVNNSTGILYENEVNSDANSLTNGRFGIFKVYLEHLNLTGHEQMGYVNEDGSSAGHAHNTFIQTAHDFGVPTGIFYLAMWLTATGYVVVTIRKGRDRGEAVYLTMAILTAFLITGLSEYAGNPSMPLCFAALLMLVTMRKCKNVVNYSQKC